jgi:hypothetical protein
MAEGHADSGATAAWLIYDMSGATEGPSMALSALQFCLLACALFGLVGSAVMYATGK